ncbi:sodium channel protein 60E [Chrysoperla carnea]|uniref:sodium channel protein 60E n=1 Tax=Chrysoperla carnea TaxID=189513 RepID=UPI001D074417|nr:sodium channel protein 60E [Chrysoperla carnea]
MATILLNCVFLAMTETVEEAEYIFLGIYTCEMLIKSIAKGFILNNYTYLRNPWNWLDFVVITSGYATICMDVGNLSGLRTFRVLRALKTVSIMPGLKTIINALLHSFKQLAEVMTLTIFCLMVFALFALQVYMGELRNKCVLHMENTNATYIEWHNWTKDEDNWLWNANEEPVICGNLTGARHCPANYTCICVGENPNHGYTSFDNFLWAMLTTFQLITLDYWENVYNMILSACGPLSVPFFTVVVFFGSFYLINLMLAVVALSYEEEAEITQEERRKDLTDHREDSTFSFDPSNLNVKKLGKHKKKRVDSRKGVLLASYSRKKTRRRKRGRSNASGVPGGGGEHEKSPPSSGGGQQSNNHNNSNTNSKQHSVTPSPSPSPRHSNCSSQRPQVLPIVKTAQIESPSKQQKLVLFDPLINPFMLPQPQPPERQPQLVRQQAEIDPRNMLAPNRGQLHSRQASSNASEGNNQSSLDDSGVVDDHEETDAVSEEVNPPPTSTALVTPVTVALSPKEIRVIKCNGVGACKKKRHHTNMYTIPPDYLSHIVVLDDLPDRNCASCSSCCVDYTGWLQFQNSLYKVVRDPLFELAITLCIVLNTIILALEHHGMSEQIRQALDIGNKVFTSIFTFECILKLMALSKEFFACGWNIFDLIIVSASLLDLIFELVDGLSVLRGLRLLRVLKLAQSWTTMKVLLSIIISTIGALGNLTFVLVIVIYIFAVIGMQLFSKDYTPAKFEPDPVPRWNFNDFFHSFMMIFRILCGEWIEPLWDCMRAEQDKGPETCFFIFLPALVMGNFMVLNLFLALLLNSFNSEELKAKKDEVGEDSKLARSFERIRSIVRKKRFDRENSENKRNMRLEQIVREVMERQGRDKNFATTIQETVIGYPREKKIYRRSYQEAIQRPISGSDFHYDLTTNYSLSEDPQIKQFSTLINGNSEDEKMAPHSLEQDGDYGENNKLLVHQLSSGVGTQHTDIDVNTESIELRNFNRGTSADTDPETSLSPPNNPLDDDKLSKSPSIKKHDEGDMNPTESTKDPVADEKGKEDGGDPTKARPWHTLVSYVDELTVGGRRNSKGQYIDGIGTFPFAFGRRKSQKVPQDCFPRKCNERCSCWDKMLLSKYGLKWTKIRSTVLSVVDTPAFEWFILVLIFASSITLCFEDIYLEFNPRLRRVLYWTNLAFCVIFTIEMILKWVALGFSKYFSSFWTVLDFVIVFVSVFSLLIEENENLKVLRSLRTLRALRPLRAISRWQGMRIVVNALMYAIPSIFNVLLVCLVFWLIFSIMGVQFFGGKFFKCVDNDGELLPITVVDNKWECAEKNYTWVNSKITFDHVGIAYLALFQVATFEGWMEVMADAVDARGVDLQPQREANLYAYIYFVIFIVCGSFFTLNLFIGVIIDNFNMLKKKYEGGVLEMFLTESQKHYYTAMKKLGRKKPQKVIKRPINQVIAMFYDLSNSRRFEIAIFVLIFLNMLTMGIEHYGQPHPVFFILEVSNAFFTTVFGLEAIVKMIGLRYHYFTVPWNMFDFWLVLASILGILMEDIMIDFPVSPTLLRVVRVFRIGRILRLIKAAKGIRKLLFALVVSLPALFNIGALLALITFIYAIIGMSVFGHVKQQGALDDMVNFETFGRSMQLLFRLMTSAGWNDVLESLMIQPPHCDPHFNNQTNGDCGYPLLAITYFTSFIIISYMIVINMYIAIILENFNQAHQEEEIGIVEDDLEMFYIRWSKYDPHATQFIRFTQLSDFIASLDPPLGISKPNIVALVSFNLPIARGNKIHCLDILHSLVKHVLGHVEETDTFRQLQEQMDIKFKKQFPTRKELEIVSSTRIWKREDKAARLIQTTFRNYIKRKHEKEQEPEVEDETTQTSSPGGGWQGRLSAFLHVHRGSRASSRKSSRASDASDLSELGGAWLNLPLLLLSSAAVPGTAEDLQIGRDPNDVSITVSQPSPDTHTPTSPLAPPPQARRRSFYNFPFFLRHQDAVEKTDDESTSPLSVKRGSMKSSGTMLSLHPTTGTTTTEEVKMRRGSLIRRKPPLERAPSGGLRLSGSALPIINTLQQPPNGTDVSILVTEPSPEAPIPVIPTSTSSTTPVIAPPTSIFQRPNLHRQQSEATVVHVLVHRESEEYNVEEDS